jgi:SAM-dependent methyltransferase
MPGITHRIDHEDTCAVGDFFDEQWILYQKFLQHDYLEHRLFYALLHAVLLTRFDGPVSLLELGCGDGSQTIRALTQVPLRRYVGIDLAAAALALARQNFEKRQVTADLVQQDLLSGVRNLSETFDVVLASYSLHHLHTHEKRDALTAIDRRLKPHGVFVLIDMVCGSGENRDAHVARLVQHFRASCPALTPRELELVTSHVTSSDFPETEETLRECARQVGFTRVGQLATGVDQLARCLCFFR